MKVKKEDKARMHLYRNVFFSGDGQEVLADILNDLSFMSMHVSADADVALNNYARRLLWKCGVWREENMREIVDKLGELTVT